VIKLVFVLHRKEGMSPEEFRRYWLEDHGPLARGILESLGAHRYVQSHALDTELNAAMASSRGSDTADGVAEIWWDDSLEGLAAMWATEEGQQGSATLIEDEAKFIDLERSSIFLSEEHVLVE
jgi:uncharacterized protein (TIGR02118 family)